MSDERERMRREIRDLREMLGGIALLVKHRNCCDGEDARTTPDAKAMVDAAMSLVKRTGESRMLPAEAPAADVERAAVVSFCRLCAANNGVMVASLLPDVRALSDRDARMFAFIADCIERGEHVKER